MLAGLKQGPAQDELQGNPMDLHVCASMCLSDDSCQN